jgi:Uma2 family endonuclease
MTEVLEEIEQAPLVVHPIPSHRMDDDEFFEFCQLNGDLRIERSAEGDIILMAPTGGSSGRSNAKLIVKFGIWAERDGTGTIFDSATGFILPNSAVRAPDVSWVLNKRLELISDDQWEKFLPLCPDFVLELRSRTDPLRIQQAKMSEYIDNGARLGWLIDPIRKQAHIYRPSRPIEILAKPNQLGGEDVLPGFTLELDEIWSRR